MALVTHQHHSGARRVHPDGSEKVGQSVRLDALPLRAVEVARQREQRAARVNGLGLRGDGVNEISYGCERAANRFATESMKMHCVVCVHLCEEETVGG